MTTRLCHTCKETDTKVEGIFIAVQQFFKLFSSYITCMKKELTNLLTVPCVKKRQQLVAKNMSTKLPLIYDF